MSTTLQEETLFVDLTEDGQEIPHHAHQGAWISTRDSKGVLTLPASLPLGQKLTRLVQNHGVEPAKITANGRHLSDVPHERGRAFARIKALLNL